MNKFMTPNVKAQLQKYGMILLGTFIFCLGTNLFIVPMGLYSGGIVGVSQVLRTVLIDYLKVPIPANFEIAGVINFAINIPLLFLAFKSISKSFFAKTITSIIAQTLFFTLLPIPKTPLLDDMLSACIIGGIVTGAGIGLILRASGSSGGIDILGFYFTQKYKGFSIGKLTVGVNAVLYLICAVLFNIQIAIYSIIDIAIFSLVMDKFHSQNINTMAVVFTKCHEIPDKIISDMHRGVTTWMGKGAYTKDDMLIFITVISKYEIGQMKHLIYQHDPHAFIIFSEGTGVSGNFEKRL